MSLKRTTLTQWILGNISQLDRTDLILIARYFEEKSKGNEYEIEEDEVEE